MDRVEEEILKALSDEIEGPTQPSDELSGLGIDSLRMAELASELEERFRIPIDAELLDVDSVQELIDYVRARMR